MKILHTITAMDPKLGGVCQAVRTIASSLSDLGIENEIVCLDAPDSPFLKNDKLTIHAIGPAQGPWAHSAALEPWLHRNLMNYDIVITHGLWQFQSQATAKAIRRQRNTPSVPKYYVMPHGMLDPYFQKAEGRKLKALRNAIYWKLFERRVINESDGLLFTCEEERHLARIPFSPYRPKKEMVVGLGVDEPPALNDAVAASFGKLGQRKHQYLLFMSRLHEKKGTDILIHALQNIYKDDASVPLVIAGPGMETNYGKSLKSIAQNQPSTRNTVTFTGMVSGDFKWATLYNCDAFVLPSHQENFGIAVVEALACGRPVLISDKVNIWREIKEANCGLIGDDTLEGTVSMLRQWAHTPAHEKMIMGQRARVLYEKNYSVRQAAMKLVEALEISQEQQL